MPTKKQMERMERPSGQKQFGVRPRLHLESWDALETALPRRLRPDPHWGNGSCVQMAALLDYSLAGVTRITEFEGFKLPG
jgi:hypothetical protein